MKLNLKAFLFSLVVLPNIANGQNFLSFPNRITLYNELRAVSAPLYESDDYGPIEDWDVSKVTDFHHLFELPTSLPQFNGDISAWDVGSVTSMVDMFSQATWFNGDISDWDVGSVENMAGMFTWARAFNRDISKWNVGSVTDMSRFLTNADSFSGDISNWDVGSVTTMGYMFFNAEAFNADISNWNVGSVEDMTYMFHTAKAFNRDVSKWNIGKVENMNRIFYEAEKFNQNLCCWGPDLSTVLFANDQYGHNQVNDMFQASGCTVKTPLVNPFTNDPTLSAEPIPSFCQDCPDPLVCSLTDIEMAWKIEALQFMKEDDKIIINTPSHGDGGTLVWKVYQSLIDVIPSTEAASTCFSNGGAQYGGEGLEEFVSVDSPSILELSIVDGIAGNANLYSTASAQVFFCVFVGLTDDPDLDDPQFFSFEELAFKVTMELEGGFEANAFNADAKEVLGTVAETEYGVLANVGVCEELDTLAPGDAPVFNQGNAVPICVCADEAFTRVDSFEDLKFTDGVNTFPAVTDSAIVATSFVADKEREGRSCKQIDSLLPQTFYNAGTATAVTATGTVDLIIGRRRRTAEVNFRSLQNVEEKGFGVKFELASATAEVESSAVPCYGMIAGMASVLLAAVMI